MASQVLSGPSNPSYTNNTGQNVRVIINFMQGSPYTPAIPGSTGNARLGIPASNGRAAIPSDLTINWAGVSVTSSSTVGLISIGRNLAHSTLFKDTATGSTQAILGTNSEGRPTVVGETSISAAVALAVASNNAVGSCALPTELILAPGETFSAVCGVHNIVAIPENG